LLRAKEEQQAVYQNRRRVRGGYGKSLLRRRGELVERSFAHRYETGGMRRTHLRGYSNIRELSGSLRAPSGNAEFPDRQAGRRPPVLW
jgi:hypothetical protein